MNEFPKTRQFAQFHTMFDAVKWRIRVDENFSAYRGLLEFVVDDSAIAAHEQTIKEDLKSKSNERPFLKKMLDFAEKRGNNKLFIGMRTAHVYKSFEIYSRQSLVVLASFLEGVITNFFYCVFCKHPNRMYNFISSGSNQNIIGKIDLKKILSFSNIEDLLFDLASEASNNASSGDYKSVLKRLVEITKGAVTLEEANKTIQIIEIRNRIVHELSQEEIDPELVANSFNSVIEFITCLENAAKKMEIPIFVFPDE